MLRLCKNRCVDVKLIDLGAIRKQVQNIPAQKIALTGMFLDVYPLHVQLVQRK